MSRIKKKLPKFLRSKKVPSIKKMEEFARSSKGRRFGGFTKGINKIK